MKISVFIQQKNLKNYIENPTFRSIEQLSSKDLNLEHLFLGLRSIVGIDETKLNQWQKDKINILLKEKNSFTKIKDILILIFSLATNLLYISHLKFKFFK